VLKIALKSKHIFTKNSTRSMAAKRNFASSKTVFVINGEILKKAC